MAYFLLCFVIVFILCLNYNYLIEHKCNTPIINIYIYFNFIINHNFSETSIASARASVMIYDDNSKKWIPSGTSSGLSKVHIFKHVINNTFRVVGRKLQDHEVNFKLIAITILL